MNALDVPSMSVRQLWRYSIAYLRPYRPQVVLVLVALVVDIAFRLSFYYAMKVLTDDAVLHRAEDTLAPILLGLAAFFAISTGAELLRDFLSADVEVRLGESLRLALLQHLHSLSVDFYSRAPLGDLVTRFTADVTTIKTALTGPLPTVVHRTLQIVACILFLLTLEWRLALVTLFVLPVALVVPRLVVSRAMSASYIQAVSDTGIAAEVQEQLSGHHVVRAFGLGPVMQQAMRRRFSVIEHAGERASRLNRLVRSTSGMGVTFTTSALTAIGVLLVFHGAVSLGTLVGFVGVLNLLGQSAYRLAEAFPVWLNASSALQRTEELLAEQPQIEDQAGALQLQDIHSGIRFENVSFGFNRGEDVVHEVSFHIYRGQSVAFVGRSGSGKSTVLALLMREHDPGSGRISVDEHDLRSIAVESYRAQFGVVFQEPFLFDRSVRDNIRLGRPGASDEEVVEAARAAQVDDAIARLPDGYDTHVGERGGRLSGGERQRITLARALLRDPAVLVLDEASSALDPAAENAFNETLRRVARGRTVISVTHRLSTPVGADLIGVLDRGRLVEQGTHEELLALGGTYRELWEQQRGFVVSEDGRTATIESDRLRRIPLFASVPDAMLATLSQHFTSRHYEAGHTVIRQGDMADTFFIVGRGRLQVLVAQPDGTERQLNVLEDGDFFGEVALLHDVPRTATVRAMEFSLLLALTRVQFDRLLAALPELEERVRQAADERMQQLVRSAGQR